MNEAKPVKEDYVDTYLQTAAEGTEATAGQEHAGTKIAEQAVISALQQVYDPEIPVNLYDLGLIYEISCLENGNVDIRMTLTTPGCPVAGEMPGMVADAVSCIENVGRVKVTLTWSPPWTQDMMSEDAKLALDMF